MANKFLANIELDAGLVDGSNSTGTSGYVLSSTGSGVAWVDASTVIGGPYLPLVGGTLSGDLTMDDSDVVFKHTDGFNYGNSINNITDLDRNLFPMIMNSDTNSIIAIILVLQQTDNSTNEIDLHNCLVNDLELMKDEIGMYSHWMGTKYTNQHILKNKHFCCSCEAC